MRAGTIDSAAAGLLPSTGATGADWHPILAAHEYATGEWLLVDPMAVPFAVVRVIEIKGERGYRAVTWAEKSADRRLLGYCRSLRAACELAHRAYLARHGPGDFAGYPAHLVS
ncbi:hypothetical protein GCM10009792_15040 [Microcella alkalica]|uniref:Uncharacterized protein n=1 Tax=Microcella alkalica TaxID=355930 RepID=A0A839EC50_9MICO|nr:hypothetical protein [Microcella alkalica]MBA8848834.1 hypothetical protein [Microcella alkalica]MBA8849057.1 hypothetical protein [Microcella alkalica]